MIKNKVTYDTVLASLERTDQIQTMFIAELGRHADVVFVQEQLYIAKGVQQRRIWYPIQREALATEVVPPPASHVKYGSTFSSSVLARAPVKQTPPPPYTTHAYAPSDTAPTPSAPQTTAATSLDQTREAAAIFFENVASNTRSASFGPGGSRVDPQTGKRVPADTPGAIPASTFYFRKLVDPETGKRVVPGTPGAVPISAFQHRKPVDSVTGKFVAAGTPNSISLSAFRNRKPVNPETGESVPIGTPGAISSSAFRQRRRIRHPRTRRALGSKVSSIVVKQKMPDATTNIPMPTDMPPVKRPSAVGCAKQH